MKHRMIASRFGGRDEPTLGREEATRRPGPASATAGASPIRTARCARRRPPRRPRSRYIEAAVGDTLVRMSLYAERQSRICRTAIPRRVR